MKIVIKQNEEIEIECFSIQDDKWYTIKIVSDIYGRLSSININ